MLTIVGRLSRALSSSLTAIAPYLKVAKGAAAHLPEKKDGPIAIAVKLLAIAEVVREGLRSDAGYWRVIREERGLEQRESETFVSLFFGTALRGAFPTRRKTIDEHTELVEVDIGDGASMVFRERHYGLTPAMSDEFLVSPGANLLGVIDRLWAAYPAGIYISIDTNEHGYGRVTSVSEIATHKVAYLSSKARNLLQRTTATQARLTKAEKHCTYLLYGPPGTGKSTFADQLARAAGGRVLQLDSSAIGMIGVKELVLLLNTLQPSALILNDLDRADTAKVKARLLYLFESFKADCVAIPLIVTANDPSKLDEALFRPRRIEKPIEFPLPDTDERLELIGCLVPLYGIQLGAAQITDLVLRTEGLAHAYIDHLIEGSLYEESDVVLADMLTLRSLVAAPAKDSSKPGSDTPPVG